MKTLILSYDLASAPSVQALLETAALKGESFEPLELSALARKGKEKTQYQRFVDRTRELFGSSGAVFSSPEYAERLFHYIIKNNYFSVVCTDPVSIEAIASVKRNHPFSIPCYGMLSDYASVPMLSETSLDGYFIPHEDMKQALVEKGVREDRLYPTGVPVSRSFSLRRGKKAARNYLVIPEGKRVYLFMTGGVSFDNIRGMCDELIRTETEDFIAFVLVSRTDEMKEKLEERYRGDDRVRVITFTKKLNIYLECADVVISKPNGVESTEAAVAGVPLVHIMTVREKESRTADFFSAREMSLKSNSISDAIAKAKRLVEEKAVAARMIQRQYMNTKSDAADRIIEKVTHKG